MISNATLDAARNGDRQAFRAIVEAFREPLFRYAHRMLGNATDAEDVFQETCVRIFMNLKQFQPGGNFRAWVYRIATNLCLDKKREGNRPSPPGRDSSVNPGVAAETREVIRAAERAMTQLPEKQRAALVLRVIEGFPYRVIAEILDTTENNARWYLFEARRQMRQMLNGHS